MHAHAFDVALNVFLSIYLRNKCKYQYSNISNNNMIAIK